MRRALLPILILAFGEMEASDKRSLEDGVFVHYNTREKTLLHQGKLFRVVSEESGHLSKQPYASIGGDPFCREIISWDPYNAPLLEEKYLELRKIVIENATCLEELLWLACSFVKHEVFSHNPKKSEQEVDLFLQEWIFHSERQRADFTLTWDGFLFAVIPLEDFVKMKRGVCRHLAPLLAYFIDKLQADEELKALIPPGETYIVRDEVTVGQRTGHHAWNLYLSSDGEEAWHIDPTWELLKNIYTETPELTAKYGKEVIEREKERFSLSRI
ncbi:MAG: hypothetical protein HYX48_04655 [Chlamydiales bacterium]|nr:hypothetical protein [Chlamydiales bacterium]